MIETNESKKSVTKQKKHYSAPQIEVIADMRKITKGGGTKNADSGGQDKFGNNPSDPDAP